MKSIICIILFLLPFLSFSNGIRLNGNQFPIEQRSTLTIYGESLSAISSNFFQTEFLFSPVRGKFHGTIAQFKFDKLSDVFNLTFRELDNGMVEFMLSIEGKEKIGNLKINKYEFEEYKWININVKFDFIKQQIVWSILKKQSIDTLKKYNLLNSNIDKITFGRNDHTIDVADFAIKNISIKNNHKVVAIPLNESSGIEVHAIDGEVVGSNSNGFWLINESYYWQKWKTFKIPTIGGYQFDEKSGKFYVFTNDSLRIINAYTGEEIRNKFENRLPIEIQLGNSFISQDNLYIYEVNNLPIGDCSIIKVNLLDFSVQKVSSSQLDMQLHHHSGTLVGKDFYIFGGFGNERYSNDILKLSILKGQWDTVKTNGEKVHPRYFTSSFYNPQQENIYFFGGMGNPEGDNSIGRNYYYDLYYFNINTNTLKKKWTLEWKDKNKIPTRNLVFDGKNDFYTLMYAEYESNSFLALYKFNLQNPKYEQYGDSINIRSDKIKTSANLYYKEELQQYFAVTNEYDHEEKSSIINIYTLNSPPVKKESVVQYKNDSSWIFWICLCGGSFSLFLIHKFKINRSKNSKVNFDIFNENILPEDNLRNIYHNYQFPSNNSIFLFGTFEVIDKKGVDITHLFNGKLKQLFLLFFTKDLDVGISSEYISQTLWPEKEFATSKNVRGVMLNNLRKVIEHMDDVKLVYDNLKYKIVFSSLYVDVLRFQELLARGTESKELTAIIGRGKFLSSIEDFAYDDLKTKIEQYSVDYLSKLIDEKYNNNQFLETISLTKILLHLDPIYQLAVYKEIKSLYKLGNIAEAKKKYERFIRTYQEYMGQPFECSFDELIQMKS